MELLKRLQAWYHSQDRSEDKFIHLHIYTLDNPGWILKLSVDSNELKSTDGLIDTEIDENNWVLYHLKDNKIFGAGGPFNLADILETFFECVERSNEKTLLHKNTIPMERAKNKTKRPLGTYDNEEDIIYWLQAWYYSYCNGDWGHSWGVRIETTKNVGWHVIIDIKDTELEEHEFDAVRVKNTETDWYECHREQDQIIGDGGALNLVDILETFRKWSISKEGDIDEWKYED